VRSRALGSLVFRQQIAPQQRLNGPEGEHSASEVADLLVYDRANTHQQEEILRDHVAGMKSPALSPRFRRDVMI